MLRFEKKYLPYNIISNGSYFVRTFLLEKWRIATLLSEKRGHPYSHVLYWIRTKLCYSLLRSAVMCLRGSRSSYHRCNLTDPSIDLACAESRVELD